MKLTQLYRTIRLLNIDVAAGACLTSAYLAKIWGINPGYELLIILFFAVWLIYTADRMLDNSYIKEINTERHRFHRHFKRWLLPVMVLVFLCLGLLVFRVWHSKEYGERLVGNGLILGLFVAVYLWLVRYKKGYIVKEPYIALFYSLGVAVTPLSIDPDYTLHELMVVTQIGFLAIMNLSLFSLYERVDPEDKHFNMMWHWSKTYIRTWFISIFAMYLVLSILVWVNSGFQYFEWPLHLMYLGFIVLFLRYKRNQPFEMNKAVADAMFLLPGLYLLM